jgi:VanZ family protein
MIKGRAFFYQWGPLILCMAVIFAFSSVPKREMPDLYQWDLIIKKSGHVVGYFLLVLAGWHALGWNKKKWWLAWVIAIVYAVTDEIHQSFVPGRTSLLSDVVIDTLASGAGVLIKYILSKLKSFS